MNSDDPHIGREDGDPAAVRAALDARLILGSSCYDSFERAQMVGGIADCGAFGCASVSAIKPGAMHTPLGLVARALKAGIHAVGIGEIDAGNGRKVAQAGAVITAVFADA